jgi:hypothetical protein
VLSQGGWALGAPGEAHSLSLSLSLSLSVSEPLTYFVTGRGAAWKEEGPLPKSASHPASQSWLVPAPLLPWET